jgi:hypothetical protein
MEVLNRYLDKLVRPEVRVFHRSRSPFKVCAVISLVTYVLLTMTLGTYLGLSPWVLAAIVPTAILALLGRMMLIDTLPIYHFQMTVIVVAAVLVWLLGEPVLPYLDITVLGLGMCVFFGRMGCFMVGCCYGRPYHWGVCYRGEHVAAGFPPYFVGVRLLPTQAAESLWALLVVGVGVGLVVSGQVPGTALAWYASMYAVARFGNEFLRGEPHRPFFQGFSEAQWTSMLVVVGVAGTGWAGALPFHPWQVGAATGLVLSMLAVALRRRFRSTAKHRLLHPRHIKEVAEAVELISTPTNEKRVIGQWTVMPRRDAAPTSISIGCTSLGIRISAGEIRSAAGNIYHYTLSSQDGGMTEETAKVLAGLILQLKQAGSSEFVKGNRDVFHLLIRHGLEKELVC